jgi:hypothetical protein
MAPADPEVLAVLEFDSIKMSPSRSGKISEKAKKPLEFIRG